MTRSFPCAAALALILLGAGGAARARARIAIFNDWGAFRDDGPVCFAIAQPAEPTPGGFRPFVTVSFWPKRRITRQIHIRLSRAVRPTARVALSIGDSTFHLVAHGADAWGADRVADADIVAAMRSGSSMSIEAVGALGGFADTYRLRGAASAIDAAALECAGK